MVFEHTNYRSFLKALLMERTRKNPAYSLRAMAQNLGLVNSQLSEVMNGKANFSLTSALRVAGKLNLSDAESEYFCWMVQLASETNAATRELVLQKINRIRETQRQRPVSDLSVDQFKQIAEWYHSPILELANLDDYEFTPARIAATLGISKIEAELAIERLARLDLLMADESGKWRRCPSDIVVRSSVPNTALRSFYRQMLEKAASILDTQSAPERASGYETMTFSPEALPEATKAIDQFLNQMVKISKKYPRKTQVYHVLVHLFNLTPSPPAKASKGKSQ